jgi:hypothetical protein
MITLMNPAQHAGDLFTGKTEYREWLVSAQQRLQKIFRRGIMRRKIRLGQAGAPIALYCTTRLLVQDTVRRSRLVQHIPHYFYCTTSRVL